MKILLSLLLLLLAAPIITIAQDGGTELNMLFLDPDYYDNLDEAKENAETVKYLDLSMQSPKLTAIDPAVYTFKNLQLLNISFNRVAAVEDGIGNCTQLENLNLSGNHYLTKVSDEIAKCTKLKEVNVKETGLSADQKAHLKTLLPEGCKLVQ